MDIGVPAKINADVADIGMRVVIEEYEVAALELGYAVHSLPAVVDSITCSGKPADIDADLLKTVIN